MERYAITGYLPDKIAKTLSSKTPAAAAGGGVEYLEVAPERKARDVVMRVSTSDITEIRTGSSKRGETLVQLILRDGASIDTIVRSKASAEGVSRFHDPTIARLTAAATVKAIEA